ncbi:hypothetical protein PSHT_06447 [Puccinia striiformis]|uniref:Retrotransposon gag domain-containing protein n=1 Tax=Puccinia striiformis TaxID=27350 RepID=A0A2S4W6P4_9BASI|nr:hypothetical protein PSHT_06447 [Puccinia striiformis]
MITIRGNITRYDIIVNLEIERFIVIRSLGNDPGVSTLLSGLHMDNPGRDETILQNSQAIANLETQARRTDDIVKKQLKEIKALSALLSDFTTTKHNTQQEFLQIRNRLDSSNNSLESRLARLEISGPPAPVVIPEPPFYPHIFFSGSVKEVYRFCSDMRNTFARLPGHFSGEKHKILYIASYFRASKDNSTDDCNSTIWWQGLLSKNAAAQGLDTKEASAVSDFVLPELFSSESFLKKIISSWPNVHEREDDWKAFEALCQRSSLIGDFNTSFNTLYHRLGTHLEGIVLCDYYQKAVDPDIANLGALRGGWTKLEDLEQKQELAVTFSMDPVGLAIVRQMTKSKTPIPNRPNAPLPNRPNPSYPSHRTPGPIFRSSDSKLSPGVPMELDSIDGLVFTWPLFVEICKKHSICIRCGGEWESVHKTTQKCPVAEGFKLTQEGMRALWVNWGGISDVAPAEVSKWSPEHQH